MKKEILKTVQKEILVPVTKTHSPSDFFKNRKGLYVWSSFSSNISDNAKQTEAGAEFKVTSFDLKERATDEEIENSLPKKHIFSEDDVCAIIAELIEKQPNGEEGVLINNGYANLFYTTSRVVNVHWHAGFGEWFVIAWDRDGSSWDGGIRVFSPATGA